MHDALKRRCLYAWVDYPGFERDAEILAARTPEMAGTLRREVVAFVQALRTEDLFQNQTLPKQSTGQNACWRWI